VGGGPAPPPVVEIALGPVAQGQGHGHRPPGFGLGDDRADLFLGVVEIVPGLEHDGRQGELLGHVQAVQDVGHVEAVAGKRGIVPAQTAVATVFVAVVRKLDDAAQIDSLAEIFPGEGLGGAKKASIIGAGEQGGDFIVSHGVSGKTGPVRRGPRPGP